MSIIFLCYFYQGFIIVYKMIWIGLPWRLSGKESACQCRRHRFDPWSWKIPHVAEQLGPCATTIEPGALEPRLLSRRGHCSEKTSDHRERIAPCLPQLEKSQCSNEDPEQPLKKKKIWIAFQTLFMLWNNLLSLLFKNLIEKSQSL